MGLMSREGLYVFYAMRLHRWRVAIVQAAVSDVRQERLSQARAATTETESAQVAVCDLSSV